MNFSKVNLSDRQKDLARKMNKLFCSIHVLQNTVFLTTHVTSWTWHHKEGVSVTRIKHGGFVEPSLRQEACRGIDSNYAIIA